MAIYPGAVASASDLLVAKNSVATRLAAAISASDTTLTFVPATATRLASYMAVRIDDEIIKLGVVSGATATGCTRAYDSSTAASHEGGRAAVGYVMAANVGTLSAEIIGIETALGPNLANVTSIAGTGVRASAYNWSLPGPVALVAGVPVVIPLSPFPAGLTAAWAGGPAHHVLIRDAIGGYESLPVTAITVGTSITVTPVSSHSAVNYTIGSANGGIQESIYASSASAIYINDGTTVAYRAITVGQRRLTFIGSGHNSSYLRFCFPTQEGFYSAAYGYSFRNLCIKAYGSGSGTATHSAGGVLVSGGAAWDENIIGRQITFNGAAVIVTAFTSSTNITVAPVPAVVVGAAWSCAVQSGGKAARLTGAVTYPNGDGDLEATGCEFYGLYDVFYADWVGGFIRLTNNVFRGIERYAAFGSATGGWAAQYVGNYLDGRASVGLFWIQGVIAGGVISDNWMQASLAHIVIQTGFGVTNELLINDNILDQDTPSTACVVVNGSGVEGSSGNCIRIQGNFIATLDIGVLTQDAYNVQVCSNRFRVRGGDAGVIIGGTTTGKMLVEANSFDITGEVGTPNYAIQVSPTNALQVQVKDNSGEAALAIAAFIGVVGAFTGNSINGNTPGINFAKLINDVGVTGAGQVRCFGNRAQNIPGATVASAATITLPLADEDEVVAITGTTNITEMNGVSARAGSTRRFIMSGILNFNTSSVADNKIGRTFGPTVAGQIVTMTKYFDNMWYPA